MDLARFERLFLLVSLLIFVGAIAGCGAANQRPPVFQMRLVLDAPSADSEPMTYTGKGATQPQVLQVWKKPLLDQTAVESAAVIEETPADKPQIRIMFTAQGSKRFAEVTKQTIHKRIAVVIDGKVYEAPMIQAEISTDWVPIRGEFTRQQATELAGKINAAVGRK
ncbi:MAG TPA: hypothetical protein VKV15_27585 [Bryobacteraceae bacterium]|nr:hypothetical protein [Bryobacteraceae bacterium]